jgi:hypothetical protein
VVILADPSVVRCPSGTRGGRRRSGSWGRRLVPTPRAVAPAEIFGRARSVAGGGGWAGRRPRNAMGACPRRERRVILRDRGPGGFGDGARAPGGPAAGPGPSPVAIRLSPPATGAAGGSGRGPGATPGWNRCDGNDEILVARETPGLSSRAAAAGLDVRLTARPAVRPARPELAGRRDEGSLDPVGDASRAIVEARGARRR